MECMEAKALKPSLRSELTQQEFMDEFYYATTAAPTGISYVAGEDCFVDELLNLQNVEFEDGYVEEEEEEEEEDEGEEKDSLSIEEETSNLSGENPVAGDFESPLTSELAVPDDDIAELEWVSHFVDDSLSDFSLLHPLGKQRIETNRSEPEPRRTGKTVLCFPPVPARPRSKRARPTTRPPAPSQLTESSLSSSSSSAFFAFPSASCRISFLSKTVGEPASKKQKKKPVVESGSRSIGAQFQRRCSHCQVQKTPQWRAGPLGAKTLCNACGVRFKSGRLFPEYRPACSPTFCSDVHSNRHQKVLEMRKKREIVEPGSGLAQVISGNCF